jgi:hypothetical protein
MSITFDEFIAQTVHQTAVAQAEAEANRKELEQQKETEARTELEITFRQTFPELVAMLEADGWIIEATSGFILLERDVLVAIRRHSADNGVWWNVGGCLRPAVALPLHLALTIADQRESLRTSRESQAVYAEQERQREADKAARAAEQSRLWGIIYAAVDEAESKAWKWPEGFELVYYETRHCTGATRNESGENEFDYDTRQSLTIPMVSDPSLMIDYPHGVYHREHGMTLIIHAAKPQISHMIARCIDDLPAQWRERPIIEVPGIRQEGNQLSADPESTATANLRNLVPKPAIIKHIANLLSPKPQHFEEPL